MHAWLWTPFFWQTFTCDPNCEDLPTMTPQTHSADDAQTPGAVLPPSDTVDATCQPAERVKSPPREIGGREGPEPTRYGDWEMRGRCIDF
jgi:hypothetical protein